MNKKDNSHFQKTPQFHAFLENILFWTIFTEICHFFHHEAHTQASMTLQKNIIDGNICTKYLYKM